MGLWRFSAYEFGAEEAGIPRVSFISTYAARANHRLFGLAIDIGAAESRTWLEDDVPTPHAMRRVFVIGFNVRRRRRAQPGAAYDALFSGAGRARRER